MTTDLLFVVQLVLQVHGKSIPDEWSKDDELIWRSLRYRSRSRKRIPFALTRSLLLCNSSRYLIWRKKFDDQIPNVIFFLILINTIILPLWTTTKLCSKSDRWGCEFTSDGTPWVAQRVWAIPTWLSVLDSKSTSVPAKCHRNKKKERKKKAINKERLDEWKYANSFFDY